MSVGIRGQGTNRSDLSMPTYSVGGYVSATQSAAATISSTTGLGGWYIHPAVTGITDVTSAAITSTSTGAAVNNNLGNAFQVTVPVTAVSGTTPTLDFRIEESFDGTNWQTLYELERISTAGIYNTPVLRASGKQVRYVRTIGGTSPSFTMSATRNILPFLNADRIARFFDRSIVLTGAGNATASLFAGSASSATLVANITAVTGTLVLKLQGSAGKVSWYDLPNGATTSITAAGAYQVTTSNIRALYVRGVVATAATTATLGYLDIEVF